MKCRIAIFASGSGTNAENIIRYFSDRSSAEVVLVVSSREDAGVCERARSLNIDLRVISKSAFENESAVLALLRSYEVDLIILAGFLLRVPPYLVRAYRQAILNIHPALLPRFGGAGMYGDRVHEAVKLSGEKETGITIHYIDEEYDRGTILFQAVCPIAPDDDITGIARKVRELEYRYYPEIIDRVIDGSL